MAEAPVFRSIAGRLSRGGRAVLDAVLFGNGLVAAAAAALTWSSGRYWGRGLAWEVPALVLAATLLVYNLDGARRHNPHLPPTVPPRRRWIVRHRPLLVAVVAAAALALLGLYPRLPAAVGLTLFLAHLALLSVAYSWPVLRLPGRRRALRDWPGLKTGLIAYVWAAVTVGLPALSLGLPLTAPPVLRLLLSRFAFILAVALLFDLRDYARDRRYGPLTLPGLLGYRAGRALALAGALVSVLPLLSGQPLPQQALLLLPAVLTALVGWFATEARSDYYYALLADGVLLVQAAVLGGLGIEG